jgi:hypothetical protein
MLTRSTVGARRGTKKGFRRFCFSLSVQAVFASSSRSRAFLLSSLLNSAVDNKSGGARRKKRGRKAKEEKNEVCKLQCQQEMNQDSLTRTSERASTVRRYERTRRLASCRSGRCRRRSAVPLLRHRRRRRRRPVKRTRCDRQGRSGRGRRDRGSLWGERGEGQYWKDEEGERKETHDKATAPHSAPPPYTQHRTDSVPPAIPPSSAPSILQRRLLLLPPLRVKQERRRERPADGTRWRKTSLRLLRRKRCGNGRSGKEERGKRRKREGGHDTVSS